MPFSKLIGPYVLGVPGLRGSAEVDNAVSQGVNKIGRLVWRSRSPRVVHRPAVRRGASTIETSTDSFQVKQCSYLGLMVLLRHLPSEDDTHAPSGVISCIMAVVDRDDLRISLDFAVGYQCSKPHPKSFRRTACVAPPKLQIGWRLGPTG